MCLFTCPPVEPVLCGGPNGGEDDRSQQAAAQAKDQKVPGADLERKTEKFF